MSQHAKWARSAPIDRPVDESLRTALAGQLKAVVRLLRAAVRHSEQDREHVHRLRVATRRAQAILDLAADFLSEKSSDRMRRRLRKIRRRAGAARDLDVQLERLLVQSFPASVDVRVRLGHRTAILRGRAQVKLQRLCERLGRRRFARDCDKLVHELAWRSDGLRPELPRFGARMIGLALVRFDESLRHWSANLDALHQIRVAGKRLRYTLEVFAPLLQPTAFDHIYEQLVGLQDAIGTLHDSSVALACWEAWAELFVRAADEGARLSVDTAESNATVGSDGTAGLLPADSSDREMTATASVNWSTLIAGLRQTRESQVADLLARWPLDRLQQLSAATGAAIADIASP